MRRTKRRQEYLSQLQKRDPEKFRAQWTKRLASWAREADQRAACLHDEKGIPVPTAFALVDKALEELAACGKEAVDRERNDTKGIMTNACCRAVANAVDPRLHRLNGRFSRRFMNTLYRK
jgi:hypothetical protein